MADKNYRVELENVSMFYQAGDNVLTNISLKLEAGSFHYLTGESGSGKSSLIKLLYFGHHGFTGSVQVLGVDADLIDSKILPGLRQQIGIVFQDFYLLEHLSILDNVALPLRVRGMSMKQSRLHAAEMLDWVGLGHHFQSTPEQLSGGEQQRVSLARAVIGKPKLLLADEPTGSVDDKMAVKLMMLFEELNRKGTTIVFATHNRDLVAEFPHPEICLENQNLTVKKIKQVRRAKVA